MTRIRYETVRCALKNELTTCFRAPRGYPLGRAADFAVPMEAERDLYNQPCVARYPALCRNEPPKPLRDRQRTP